MSEGEEASCGTEAGVEDGECEFILNMQLLVLFASGEAFLIFLYTLLT